MCPKQRKANSHAIILIEHLCIFLSAKRRGVGVCLALRTLVREVKRTLAIVGSWIGPLSIKYGLDSRAPQQK